LPLSTLENRRPLAGQLVVFTGKLSLLGRRDARALVAHLGGATADEVSARTTMLVVGAEGFAPLPGAAGGNEPREKSHKLRRAEELNAGQLHQIRIISEEDFCRLAGVKSADALRRQYYAMRDLVARYPSVREHHIRYLVKCGALDPEHRTNSDLLFGFADLAFVKQLHEALEQGVPFRSFVHSIVASRSGQLRLDFRLDAPPAKIISLSDRPPKPRGGAAPSPGAPGTTQAEALFLAAAELDNDAATLDQAAATYRRALEFDPYLTPAIINLANIHYGRNELAEAQALYERAIGLEPDFFEAHFNLGNIYHDLARFGEAQTCYREALRLNPDYADAHFYLAVTFEKMGRSPEARPHWRAYRRLAPDGEWAELAKEFSE
jgi:tetratricopeptide (TPR) repeat protein